MIDVAVSNLTSPAVLAFAIALLACQWGTSLRLPESVGSLLSTYLLLAIGLKGGLALRDAALGELVGPATATLALGVVTPLLAFFVLRRMGRFSVPESAGIAAHYGSVSIVTFTAALTAAATAGLTTEGFLPALVALLEVPGIAIALYLARGEVGHRLGEVVRDVFGGKSVVLLGGGVLLGAVADRAAVAAVEPLFVGLFPGMLALFLLDLGAMTGERLTDIRKAGWFLAAFAVTMPLVLGSLGFAAGMLAGMAPGGVAVMAVMAASASYIAAPAAVRVALPGANPALGMGAALGVTFPFNLFLGIPLAMLAAEALA